MLQNRQPLFGAGLLLGFANSFFAGGYFLFGLGLGGFFGLFLFSGFLGIEFGASFFLFGLSNGFLAFCYTSLGSGGILSRSHRHEQTCHEHCNQFFHG